MILKRSQSNLFPAPGDTPAIAPNDTPITADQALAARAKAAAENPIAEHGGDRKSQESTENQGDNITLKNQRGTSQEYLLRRIARDKPELLDQIGKDKPYKSARAAAKAAGIPVG